MAAKIAKEWAKELELAHRRPNIDRFEAPRIIVELSETQAKAIATLLVRLDGQVEAAKVLINRCECIYGISDEHPRYDSLLKAWRAWNAALAPAQDDAKCERGLEAMGFKRVTKETCKTCGGHMYVPQSPVQIDLQNMAYTKPCPDCNPGAKESK
jgi:hypothetical protein